MDNIKVSAIVAISGNQVIGVGNALPWHLPADLRFFKKNTTGHAIIMGRKTFESIGRPLPNRTNIVISRNASYKADGCFVTGNMTDALNYAVKAGHTRAFIIGGAEIFKIYLDWCDELILTEVQTTINAPDAIYLDAIHPAQWQETWSEFHPKDEKHAYDFIFRILERKR